MTQQTFSSSISCTDVGLHSGKDITMTMHPADAGHGIVFVRTDLADNSRGDNVIPARWDYVVDTQLCTVIGNKQGASVGTIEHVMSALRGCGIDNALIEIDGPEVPAMDGSAIAFVELIEKAGVKKQNAPKRIIKILKEIRLEDDGKIVSLSPCAHEMFAGTIDFDHPDIGHQKFETQLLNGNYKHDIAGARTFGFLHEVEWMRSQGLALGGSMDNAIVLNDETVMNPDGLRFADEFIRHKLLDAIGDLYLAGMPIEGRYYSEKAGHAINNKILHALFAQKDAWCIIEQGADEDRALKGASPAASAAIAKAPLRHDAAQLVDA